MFRMKYASRESFLFSFLHYNHCMRHFQTLFLDFDEVIVQYLSLFQQFFREETDDILL